MSDRHTLLLVTLGPVQDFIASARRCQDLWFGSWLLSDLARATAAAIDSEAGGETLIFPAALGNEKPSVANKILAVLRPEHSPAAIAAAGKAAMTARLSQLAQHAFATLPRKYFRVDLANQQVGDLMEYMWSAVPLEPDYGTAREEAEKLLAARKNMRCWGAVPEPLPGQPSSGVPKCSIDGQRESVLTGTLYTELTQDRRRRQFGIKDKEQLCGVCLLKRLGENVDFDEGLRLQKPSFHSTSHIASAPILARIAGLGASAAAAADDYFDELETQGIELSRFSISAGAVLHSALAPPLDNCAPKAPQAVPRTYRQSGKRGLDGYLLYEDRLPEICDEYSASSNPADLSAAQRSLRTFLRRVGLSKPTAYYAVLLADGDHMGKAIDDLANLSAHRELSAALERFAVSCARIVELHGGSLIYSGGDDVLALLPLHSALECASQLRTSFQNEVTPACQGHVATLPTLSVGIGISHHMDDLADARALAKTAERLAKQERNSLAVVVQKRSGGSLQCTGTWTETHALHTRLNRWASLYAQQKLPEGLAYQLESAMATFEVGRPDGTETRGLGEVIAALARRVFSRRRADGGAADVDEALIKGLKERISGTEPLKCVRRLSEELQVARVFAEAYETAWPSTQSLPAEEQDR